MTPQEKKFHGQREQDDDGFTYVHGKHKGGRVKRTRNRLKTIRLVRHDKRAVKAQIDKELRNEHPELR